MFILDKPYVSPLLFETLKNKQYPVLSTNTISELGISHNELNLISPDEAIKRYNNNGENLYSNSENALLFVQENLDKTDIPRQINICKDKNLFRETTKSIYLDYYFKKVNITELDKLDVSALKFPFIIKPNVGFFSLSVHKVKNEAHWKEVQKKLHEEIEENSKFYPESVVNSSSFIIEEVIDGEEYAVDVFFNNQGTPIIMNILHHVFPSADNLADRVYYTSKELIEKFHQPMQELMSQIGKNADFKNFMIHIELRQTSTGDIIPIEANPMRFTGWCLADLAYFAYGANVYEYIAENKTPDWNELLKNKDGKTYSMVIATVPEDYQLSDVESIDYDAFLNHFSKPLELRKIDYTKYPIFGFVFAETETNNWNEIEYMLHSDLKEYIKLKRN